MSLSSRRTSRGLATPLAFLAAGALLVGCTSNEPAAGDSDSGAEARAASSNDDSGDTVVIGFSGPAADHGWLAAINNAAQEEADKYDDVELRVAEGTNDAISQIMKL